VAGRRPGRDPQDGASYSTSNQAVHLSEAFRTQEERSVWGSKAMAAVDRGFVTTPFFSDYLGTLETDCRVDVCRMEWQVEDFGALRDEERERLLTIGRYELLALAASNAEDVGSLITQWNPDSDPPRFVLFFSRRE
jgi:hypothetical protein